MEVQDYFWQEFRARPKEHLVLMKYSMQWISLKGLYFSSLLGRWGIVYHVLTILNYQSSQYWKKSQVCPVRWMDCYVKIKNLEFESRKLVMGSQGED